MLDLPNIGDIISSNKLELTGQCSMVYAECPNCHELRWQRLSKYKKGINILCLSCSKSGPLNPGWTGGRLINAKGYCHMCLQKDSPYYAMTDGRRGRVLEHRIIMAEHIGRCLDTSEVVHHINGIRNDNRIENLELISGKGKHNTHENENIITLINEIKRLNKIINEQAKEIKSLKKNTII